MSTETKTLQRLLTPKQVAAMTGLPLWTIRNLVKKGEGPAHVRFGRKYKFPENGIALWWDQWLKKQQADARKRPQRLNKKV